MELFQYKNQTLLIVCIYQTIYGFIVFYYLPIYKFAKCVLFCLILLYLFYNKLSFYYYTIIQGDLKKSCHYIGKESENHKSKNHVLVNSWRGQNV